VIKIEKDIWYVNCDRCKKSWKQEYKGQYQKCPRCYTQVLSEEQYNREVGKQ